MPAHGEAVAAAIDHERPERQPASDADAETPVAAVDSRETEEQRQAEDERGIAASLALDAAAPDSRLENETSPSTALSEGAVEPETETAADAPLPAPLGTKEERPSPEEALELLASRDRPPSPDEPAVEPAGQQAENTGLGSQPDPAPEPSRPAPVEIAARDAAASGVTRPVASAEDGRPRTADRAELPPRVKQALKKATAETETAAATGAGSSERTYHVQLAAVEDEAAARIYWREVNERLPDVFADVEPIFDQRMVDERLYLRVWVGTFEDRVDAVGYCQWLKEQSQDCFVTRADSL